MYDMWYFVNELIIIYVLLRNLAPLDVNIKTNLQYSLKNMDTFYSENIILYYVVLFSYTLSHII